MMPKSPIGHPFASTGTGVRGLAVAAGPKPRDCLTRSTNTSVRAQLLIGSWTWPGATSPRTSVYTAFRGPVGAAPRLPQAAARLRASAAQTPGRKFRCKTTWASEDRDLATAASTIAIACSAARRQIAAFVQTCARKEELSADFHTWAWSLPSPADQDIFFDLDTGVREENSGRWIGSANSQRGRRKENGYEPAIERREMVGFQTNGRWASAVAFDPLRHRLYCAPALSRASAVVPPQESGPGTPDEGAPSLAREAPAAAAGTDLAL